MFRFIKHIVMMLAAACMVISLISQCTMPGFSGSRPKNVIIMISDGCGFNHVDAAGCYEYGEKGNQGYESFPVRYAVSTYSSEGHGYHPDSAWVSESWLKQKYTDSAASATAISTGQKTKNGMLGLDAGGNPAGNILERMENTGKASGVVTSVPFHHATPAGFIVHQKSRNDISRIIDEMLSQSTADVIMGAGHPAYDANGRKVSDEIMRDRLSGMAPLWAALHEGSAGNDADRDGIPDPWVLIESREAFRKLQSGPAPKRVFGLAPVSGTLQQGRSGDAYAPPYEIPLTETVPTLAEMSLAAINVLDDDPDGFFLMIEGGAVDWAAHRNQSGRLIEEQIDFNQAVRAVTEWIEQSSSWKETLLIITADHETGLLTGPDGSPGTGPVQKIPVKCNGKGRVPGLAWHSGSHTNSLVPFYAKGPGSRRFCRYADETDPVRGRYLDNTEIARALFDLYE